MTVMLARSRGRRPEGTGGRQDQGNGPWRPFSSRVLTEHQLYERLDALGIAHSTTRHPPVFTAEQGEAAWGDIPGMHCKNLFLKDPKGQLWLVVVPADRRVDLKALATALGIGRLSFGKPGLLEEVLGVPPGSVTPFALVNDAARRVRVVLDARMMAEPVLNYHPLTNEATTTISNGDFRRFLKACGHETRIVALPG